MPKYQIERDITEANGTQTFTVEAENEIEARKKFSDGSGELIDEELNAEGLEPVATCEVYEI